MSADSAEGSSDEWVEADPNVILKYRPDDDEAELIPESSDGSIEN